MTDTTKKKISIAVNRDNKIKGRIKGNKTYEYICDHCKESFKTKTYHRNNRPKHCDDCKRNVPHSKINDEISLLDISKRTIAKILKRANMGCSICGWHEASCDIHHIIEKSKGGNDDSSNLVILCPNCHRISHGQHRFSIELLKEKSIENTFSNWKEYYHISN
jgi:5-methylcytosine-specific restriction endonuclease McrA